jgi:hypothetical protein
MTDPRLTRPLPPAFFCSGLFQQAGFVNLGVDDLCAWQFQGVCEEAEREEREAEIGSGEQREERERGRERERKEILEI